MAGVPVGLQQLYTELVFEDEEKAVVFEKFVCDNGLENQLDFKYFFTSDAAARAAGVLKAWKRAQESARTGHAQLMQMQKAMDMAEVAHREVARPDPHVYKG